MFLCIAHNANTNMFTELIRFLRLFCSMLFLFYFWNNVLSNSIAQKASSKRAICMNKMWQCINRFTHSNKATEYLLSRTLVETITPNDTILVSICLFSKQVRELKCSEVVVRMTTIISPYIRATNVRNTTIRNVVKIYCALMNISFFVTFNEPQNYWGQIVNRVSQENQISERDSSLNWHESWCRPELIVIVLIGTIWIMKIHCVHTQICFDTWCTNCY